MTWLWIVAAIVALLAAIGVFNHWRTIVTVYPWETALVYRNGRFRRVLAEGRHVLIGPRDRIHVEKVPIVGQVASFGQTDVVTSDQFAFRVQISVEWRVTDARALYESTPTQFPGASVQPALLAETVASAATVAISTRTLDEVVAAPAALAAAIAAELTDQIAHVAIERVLVTRLQFPPETRRMLTDAERARREGLAQLERARGEQAALRSLANAARLIRDNPELANLRLLQTIEAAKGPTTIVVGDPRTVTAP